MDVSWRIPLKPMVRARADNRAAHPGCTETAARSKGLPTLLVRLSIST